MAALPSTEKLIGTYQQVAIYYGALEKLAAKYQTEDKGRCALAAVGLTVRFLQRLKVSRHVLAPLLEASNIIRRDIGASTRAEQRRVMDIFEAAVVSLHMEEESIKLTDALKRVHGRDADAAKRLKFFRNNMKKGKSKGAQETHKNYLLVKRELRKRYPTDTAKSALRDWNTFGGKKG
jgi:hypothetical protein